MKLYQNVGMPKDIEASGCGVLCAYEMARRHGVFDIASPSGFTDFVVKLERRKVLKAGCFVASWDDLFAAMGLRVKCRYEKPGYVPKPAESVMEKWIDDRELEHFVFGDYDPWWRVARTHARGRVKELLIVEQVTEAVKPATDAGKED